MAKTGKTQTLIVNGVNYLGRYLTRTLLDQGGAVSILDSFDTHAREFIKGFKEQAFKFYDLSILSNMSDKIESLDYLVLLLHDGLPEPMKTKDYSEFIQLITETLDLAYEKDAKVVVVTAMDWEKRLKNRGGDNQPGYKAQEIQRFGEKAINEYIAKVNLDGRIVRVGELYGRGMDLDKESLFLKIVNQAVEEEEIVVPGEGLQYLYYVHVLDAVYGILKALFSRKAKGEVFTLANPEEISLLTLAHKVIEHSVVAKKVRFEKDATDSEPIYEKAYELSPNLTTIGWEPKVGFERGLAQVIEYIKESKGLASEKREKERKKLQGFGKKVKSIAGDSKDIQISIKMDDVLPVEMGKEKVQAAERKKIRKAEERKKTKEKIFKGLKYLLYLGEAAAFVVVYLYLLLPVVGVIKSTYFTRQGLESFNSHLESNRQDIISEDIEYIEKQNESFELYIDRLEWLFRLTKSDNAADKLAANVYGANSYVHGVEYLLTVENGYEIATGVGTAEANNLQDKQAINQARLQLYDAEMWLQKGSRLIGGDNFWAPYEASKQNISEIMSLVESEE